MAEDNSILTDDEMEALDGLLAKAEEVYKNSQEKQSVYFEDDDDLSAFLEKADEEQQKEVPKLKEDSSFAAAMSVEVAIPSGIDIPKLSSQNDGCDSSDDEDVNNFLERKYNEYGRDINKNLKQSAETKKEAKISRDIDQNSNRVAHKPKISRSFQDKPKAAGTAVATSAPKMIQPKLKVDPIFTDPIFGLRIINPLISSQMLTERMNSRKAIALTALRFHIDKGDHSLDWVIAGVIVSKSPVKTTKNDKPYSIWKISDLKGEIKTASLFLFQDAHRELWKTAVGMVIAVLNPSILDSKMDYNEVASLSIDNSQKVMILGQSKDLGKCKSKKKNGEVCGAVVNLNECDYCVFHVKQEFGKLSKRSELQSSTAGRGLEELRNKVLGKNEVFYGGQIFSAIPAKKSAKLTAKDNSRLSILSDYNVSPNASSVNHTATARKEVKYASRGGPVSRIAEGVQSNKAQRCKDLERLKILESEAERLKQTESPSTAPKISIPEVSDKFKGRSFSFDQKPKLSQTDLSFDMNFTPIARKAAFDRSKAAQLLKRTPIAKSNPNMIKHRGTDEGILFIVLNLDLELFKGMYGISVSETNKYCQIFKFQNESVRLYNKNQTGSKLVLIHLLNVFKNCVFFLGNLTKHVIYKQV
ncbi:MCM10 family protein [Megaselia abdita]